MLKGVLLDVGYTIAYPPSGNWFLTPLLPQLLEAYDTPLPEQGTLVRAVEKGLEYLDANHHVRTLDEELRQFRAFYRMVLQAAGLHGAPDGLIRELARLHVTTNDNFALYPDVLPALEHMKSRCLLLGILSDTWPSLRQRLRELEIAGYFATVTISAEEGCCKPNEPIYRKAVGGLGIPGTDVLFIDDDEPNLIAARRLGLECLRIRRTSPATPSQFPTATSLAGVVRHIDEII